MLTLSVLSGLDFLNSVQFLAETNFCLETKSIWILIGKIIGFIQIAIPVLIVLLGTIDLGKAVISGEEKKVKEAQGVLIRRILYGVAIFFIVMIIAVVFGVLDDTSTSTSSGVDNAKGCFGFMKEGIGF